MSKKILLSLLLACLLFSNSAIKAANFYPQWQIGDWWLVEGSTLNVFGDNNQWIFTWRILYKVVSKENVDGLDCFVVERWLYPIDKPFTKDIFKDKTKDQGKISSIYYFRAEDKSLLQRINYDRKEALEKEFKQSFARESLPYINDAQEWFPAFPFPSKSQIYNQYKAYELNTTGQVKEETKIIKFNDLQNILKDNVNMVNSKYYSLSGLTKVYDLNIYYGQEMEFLNSLGEKQKIADWAWKGRQIWSDSLPWFVYSEIALDSGTVMSKYWLVDKGSSEDFQPYKK